MLTESIQKTGSREAGWVNRLFSNEGYTPEQRFFLGFGRVWCEKRRPEFSRMLVSVDPHSPGKYRVNGVVQNMPEFQKAWGCKAEQPMVAETSCHRW